MARPPRVPGTYSRPPLSKIAASLANISRLGFVNIAAASATTAIGAVEIIRTTRDRFVENHPHAESHGVPAHSLEALVALGLIAGYMYGRRRRPE